MALPIFQDSDETLMLLQTRWAGMINPLLVAPISQGRLLQASLVSSQPNVINHKLGRKLQGWIIVGQSAATSLYDNQKTNSMPELTLILVASAPAQVTLWVF